MNSGKNVPNDEIISVRPQSFKQMIGRKKEKEILQIAINATKKRKEPLDHVLFYGPPGLGKTTFSLVIAKELGVNIKITSGPAISRQGDMAAILTNLNENDVLFIDEIHRLNKTVEEILYPAMEDYMLDIIIGKGPKAKSMRLSLPRFTLIGATTRLSLLGSPLRDRFGILLRLDYFSNKELCELIMQAAKSLHVKIEYKAAEEISRRSRGTGRIAIRLLKRVRDHMEIKSDDIFISEEIANKALDMLEIDELGLDKTDRKLLSSISEKFKGGPIGLATMASVLSEDKETIANVIEPYLIKVGLLERTARGRVLTPMAYTHLGVKNNVSRKSLL